MPPLVDALALLLAVGAAALAVDYALRRAARRVPRWLARRRGLQVGGGTVPGEAPFALVCLAARIVVWAVALRTLAGRFWLVQGLQVRLERLVGMSFEAPLFTLGERAYSLVDLATLSALLVGVWLGVGIVTRGVRRHVLGATGADAAVQHAVAVVVRYALSLLGTIVLLQAWGIDMSSLTIVASVVGVGLGFGLQNIANNFVSGFLLTMERPIKPGDFVQVGELLGTVERIGGRSTEIRTLDRVTILVPNAHLLEKEVINWSHGDPVSRIHVPVSIEYGAELRRARAAMLEAARAHPDVLDDPRATVELHSFGESGIQMELLVWTRSPRRQNVLRSDLNFRILEAFARHGIAIPFPQQDVHLSAPALERAVTAWARRRFTPEELDAAAEPVARAAEAEALPEIRDEPSPETWTDVELAALVERMRGPGGIPIADRRHRFTTYPRSFVGRDAVAWLRQHEGLTRDEAVAVGEILVRRRILHHVLDEHGFEDGNLFYRFHADETADRRPDVA